MKRCAFLSMDNLEDFFVYDRMVIEPLNARGWLVEEVSWRDESINYDDYDVVVVRSTWDYQQDAEAFLACLQRIENSSATLENSFATMKWNLNKTYLRDLENDGVKIVPTLWLTDYDHEVVESAFSEFDSETVVIKPCVSANADDTFRFTKSQLVGLQSKFTELFANRDAMVQPFLTSIVENGEYSLFYFAGSYSHAILKTPEADDFRVQEEHGGQLKLIDASPALKSTADKTLQALPDMPLYARVDLAEYAGEFKLMEVELIEPSLYFNMDEASIGCFVEAFVSRHGEG